jgi:hypothetical protein
MACNGGNSARGARWGSNDLILRRHLLARTTMTLAVPPSAHDDTSPRRPVPRPPPAREHATRWLSLPSGGEGVWWYLLAPTAPLVAVTPFLPATATPMASPPLPTHTHVRSAAPPIHPHFFSVVLSSRSRQ